MKVVTQPMTWIEAKKHCEDDGASLASLRNGWSQSYVELMSQSLNASLWIGLNKNQTGGYFRYIDGWHMGFTHWGENEPSTDRPCVYVDVYGKWKTANCNQTINSVCIKSTDVQPTGSSFFPGVCPDNTHLFYTGQTFVWQQFKGYCYIFISEEKRWADAAASCVRQGGSLASIEEPSEQEFIQNNAKVFEDSHTSFWIGLYKTHKGEWLWLDKTVMDYTNWSEGQPDDRSHGGISTSDGTWKTGRPNYYRPYICKTPKVLQSTASTPNKPVPRPPDKRQPILAVVAVITVIAIGGVIAFFLFKKYGRRLPIPDILTTFDNPLFFRNEQSPSEVADISKPNAEKENPEPLITM
ncbi:macrophage mannose receptor 1-like [Xiphias gladius]|uniref:macrophage mannose receptor 1-like n=1 Tax=Xiphias gladius TaxID=8245 RepID=UPI001A9814B6|nr:macrophage mannose receptor 1-like [Xiphias gladius]